MIGTKHIFWRHILFSICCAALPPAEEADDMFHHRRACYACVHKMRILSSSSSRKKVTKISIPPSSSYFFSPCFWLLGFLSPSSSLFTSAIAQSTLVPLFALYCSQFFVLTLFFFFLLHVVLDAIHPTGPPSLGPFAQLLLFLWHVWETWPQGFTTILGVSISFPFHLSIWYLTPSDLQPTTCNCLSFAYSPPPPLNAPSTLSPHFHSFNHARVFSQIGFTQRKTNGAWMECVRCGYRIKRVVASDYFFFSFLFGCCQTLM